jgi:hypothetical protein
VSFFADSSFFIFSDIEFVFAFDILYQLLEWINIVIFSMKKNNTKAYAKYTYKEQIGNVTTPIKNIQRQLITINSYLNEYISY